MSRRKANKPQPERTYRVTTHAEAHPDHTATVSAPNEWKARTRAMFSYPHKLNGATIAHTVILVDADGAETVIHERY
jgi:hypothetical protein